MALKDLNAYLKPNLELPYGGKTYVVKPPTKEVGLQLAALNAAGVAAYSAGLTHCPTCGRSGAVELPEGTQEILKQLAEKDVAALSLGEDVYAQMIEDKVPGPHLDEIGVYALYYWTLGEETADAIFEAQHRRDGGASGEALSASSTSKPGPRTASGNRTQRRASSRGTGAPRKR